ncbi:OBAP family protein [Spirosoma sp.]|uniref:OBAP family protein n=1 Tax=Spirosoma sp. TaxID=1899569 RepID=UPI00262AB9F5|nr:OBAP family protein [Spirosoma sp.]MCX6214459.1 OBAP family protein [Spirosoma sp.]
MTSFSSQSIFIALTLLGMLSCGGKNTSSNVQSPGAEKTAKTKTLEAGADVLQNKAPLNKLNMYLDGFHFYNGHMDGQMEAHHYCSDINEDLTQCIIYDGNGANAKIMGVEYIVSEKLFKTLPAEERKLWHSHVHEVKSGQLIAPGIPQIAEHELMEKLVSTYGKTFHTWHTDRELTLPVGHPMIMMGFTKDGQVDTSMVVDRDKRFDVSTAKNRENRADIPAPAILPGANAWQQGEVRQLQVVNEARPAHTHK